MGIFFILIGTAHILFPSSTAKLIRQMLITNPLIKNKKSLEARPKFIVIFGITWIILGMIVFF
jgi:hypothetical protein